MTSPESQAPLVSVVCAWYNRADYLHDTLSGLLGQEGVEYEVIVVNDGSSDGRVAEILDAYRHPRLRVIHQANQGFVAAIRTAIDAARGRYIAIQGAGDVSLANRLSRQADVLDADSQIGIVGCLRQEKVIGGVADGKTVQAGCGRTSPTLDDLLHRSNPFSHGEVMFRRTVYDTVGGYRAYFKFAQDRDLWIRMAVHCRMHVVQEVLYERRTFTQDGVSASKEKILLQQALSNFARQCHHDRIRYGFDFIEKYGTHAGLFRRPSAAYAKTISKLALQSLYLGETSQALDFGARALDEKRTAVSSATYLLAWLASRNGTMRRLIVRALGRHPNSSIWAGKS
ncbi:glycosyltransferase [Luteimonas sp. gir]|uniref:glycosyltransferase family 2 protein n=1 Tax=Luteimonas sp. gir TaxID=3127960 RepID=UPI003075C8E5